MSNLISNASELSVEDYLRGCVAYTIPDNTIRMILAKRNLLDADSVEGVEEKDLELATADIYMWCSNVPTTMNGMEDSDGGWKHKESSWQMTSSDKTHLRSMANSLYAKWGEKESLSKKIRIINL